MKLIKVILCFSQTIKAKSFLPCDYVRRYERRYGCRDDKAIPISRIIVSTSYGLRRSYMLYNLFLDFNGTLMTLI